MLDESTLQTLWTHSLAMATCTRALMEVEGSDATSLDDAFTAGLLHDVGTLVLISQLPELYDRSRQLMTTQNLSICRAESDVIGATHAQIGAYLMGLWGLSDVIIDALAYHHQPSACPAQAWSPLAAVHIAEALVHELTPDLTVGPTPALDTDYLEALGLQHRLPQWRAHTQQALRQYLSAAEEPLPFPSQYEVATHV
jgi:HD-like signal output (HDOD) protein